MCWREPQATALVPSAAASARIRTTFARTRNGEGIRTAY
jgi:hypothetical protein